MPWGSNHYPFGDLKEFNPRTNIVGKIFGNTCGTKAYPADFIAEGLDQTRGWFYSMLVLGVALFGTSPFKKVLVNGLVLAEDGEKMSKSKNNYPDPMLIVDKYGADSLRYYLMSSPAVRAQDLCFSEKGVDEVTKKVINRLLNVVTFYETYAKEGAVGEARGESQNILDQWIITRLNETIVQVTTGLEAGEIDRATRPFMDLIDDLSTWYLRRSRDRFKGDDLVDKNAALATTKFILLEIAKLMAPFTPFVSDDIYNRVGGTLESVHLESWPVATKVDAKLLADMKLARDIASQGLEARMSAKINVRQPLSRLSVKESKITDVRLEGLIKDEVNVKEILFGATIETLVSLDTSLTPALKEEGMVRELIRVIQDLRKEKGLTVSDKATLIIEADGAARNFIEKNREAISRTTSLKDIKWESVTADVIKIGDMNIKVGLN